MKFSLICTVFNEEDNILEFLLSYKKQSKLADEFIILDGGSLDNTVNIINDFSKKNPNLNIKVLINDTCNKKYSSAPISKGRNLAIKEANFDVIVTTDAGCILDSNWFEFLTKPYEKNSAVMVTGGIYNALPVTDFGIWYIERFMPKSNEFNSSDFLPSSRNFSFKKSVWSAVGGYPLGTFAGEDTKYVIDIKKLGYDIVMTSALVQWECPRDLSEAANKHYQYAYGDGYHKQFYFKYFKTSLKLPFLLILNFINKKFEVKYFLSKNIVKGFWCGFKKRYFHDQN